MITPTLFTAGTNGLILKTIEPSEFVQVAGLGFGVITTVAQVPVPPPPPQEGSVEGSVVAVSVLESAEVPQAFTDRRAESLSVSEFIELSEWLAGS